MWNNEQLLEYQGVKRMIILISQKRNDKKVKLWPVFPQFHDFNVNLTERSCLKKFSENYIQQQIGSGLLLLIYILILLAYNDIYNHNQFVITTLFKNTVLCIGRTLTRNTFDQQVWGAASQHLANLIFVLDSIHRCHLMSRL